VPGCQHRIEIDRSSSATKGIVAVKIEPISANEGCTRLWKSEIHFDEIFEGLGVQPHFDNAETCTAVLAEHRDIVAALAARNPEQACKTMRNHLQRRTIVGP
jgi:DNA-binding GntR family transcriptional regulator